MSLSDRARRKGATSAQQFLPPGTVVREYVVGRAHARMATGAIVAGSIFGTAFVVALAFGAILIPGGLILIYVLYAVRPPRGVVAADQGLAVLDRSFLNSRPTKVLALLPTDAARHPAVSARKVTLTLGVDRVTFPRREYERLATAVGSASPSSPGYPPPVPSVDQSRGF
jgi:hypothetical protein